MIKLLIFLNTFYLLIFFPSGSHYLLFLSNGCTYERQITEDVFYLYLEIAVVEKHLKKVLCFQMVQAAAKTAVIGCNSLVCCKNVAVFLLFYTIMRM